MQSSAPVSWKEKLVSPEKALEHIEAGMNIFIGTGVGEPRTMVKQLMGSEAHKLHDLTLIQLVSFGIIDARIFTDWAMRGIGIFDLNKDLEDRLIEKYGDKTETAEMPEAWKRKYRQTTGD